MLDTKKKVTLWGLSDAIFTFGLILLAVGVGLIQANGGTLEQSAATIGLGIVLIILGLFVYWIKAKYGIPDQGSDEGSEGPG